jgi:hypothetical protein
MEDFKKLPLKEKVEKLTGKKIGTTTSAPATATATTQSFVTPKKWDTERDGPKLKGAQKFSIHWDNPKWQTTYRGTFSEPQVPRDKREQDAKKYAKKYANVTERTEPRKKAMAATKKAKMDKILLTGASSKNVVEERQRRADAAADKKGAADKRGGRKKSRKKRRRRKTKRRRKKRKTKRKNKRKKNKSKKRKKRC